MMMSAHQEEETQQMVMKRRGGRDNEKVGSILCLGLTDPSSHSVPEMHVNPSVLFIKDSSSSVISFCNNRNGMLEPINDDGELAEPGGLLKFYKIQTSYCETPILEICNGVLCTGIHEKVSLLLRNRPSKGVGDCLYIRPSNVQNLIVNIPPRRAHVPKAGDIALVSCMNMNLLCKKTDRSNNSPQPQISGGFQAVIFLPKIHDMPEFQRSVLDNAVLLRELGHSICAMVGCFTILRVIPRTTPDVVRWNDERISEFITREYPALEALYDDGGEEEGSDHHEEEEEEDHHDDDSTTTTIATRLRSSDCDHKKKKGKH